MTTLAGDPRFAERNHIVLRRNFFLDSAIQIFVLEKNYRVVIADRRLDQSLGIVGSRGANNFQAGCVHEPHLRILRVKWAAMHVASARPAQNHGSGRSPAVVGFCGHVDDLIEGAADEIHELKFGDGAHSSERRSESRADDRRLRDGSVDHALGSEAIDEAVGDLESAAVDADIFAEAEDGRIALHFFPDSLANGFEVGDGRHEGEEEESVQQESRQPSAVKNVGYWFMWEQNEIIVKRP